MNSNKDKRSWILLILAPLVVLAIMISLWQTRIVRQLENVTMDWRFTARADTDPPPDERITLIGIGEPSLQKWGRWEEWTRDIHGQFVRVINTREPKVLAFDFFFTEPSRDQKNDEAFFFELEVVPGAITGTVVDELDDDSRNPYTEPTIGKTAPIPNVVGDISKIIGGESARTPISGIATGAWTGIVNSPSSNIDGMRRSIPLVGRIGKNVYPSLALQSLIQYSGAKIENLEVVLARSVTVIGENGESWTIPIDEKGFMLINYRNPDGFRVSDYGKVVASIALNEELENLPPIKDQIVIVGQAAVGLSDFGPTPHSGEVPLFKIQANALSNILLSDYLKRLPIWIVAIAWLLVAWITLLALKKAHVIVAVAAPFLVVAGFGILAFHLFESRSLAIPIILPSLGFVLIHTTLLTERLVTELREKNYIRAVFGSFVSKDVVDQIIQSGEMPTLGGQETEITMFFSDIQGFSAFSEVLTPERLVVLMNDYLSEMTEILMGGQGTLDKYIGDAIVGMFGAPLATSGHAHNAVVATIAMQKRQAELREKWKNAGDWPEIVHRMQTRIGLNTGKAVIGQMGSTKQMNFTMMGDNVNLAARCESGAKSYGVHTMITGETYEAATAIEDDITYRYLDRIIVKGRTLPVKVYEVIDFKMNTGEQQSECIDLYAKGLSNYFNQEFRAAMTIFQNASAYERWQPGRDLEIEDNPSLVMVERCRKMEASPPGEDWDGVYRMTTK